MWRFLRKTKMDLTQGPAIALLDINPKDLIQSHLEMPYMSTDKWIRNMWYIYSMEDNTGEVIMKFACNLM